MVRFKKKKNHNKYTLETSLNLILRTYTTDALQRYSTEYCSRMLLGVLLTNIFCVQQHLENANLCIRSSLVLSPSCFYQRVSEGIFE